MTSKQNLSRSQSIKEAFWGQFPLELQPYLTEFASYLATIKADVYILLARKAACLVDCLLSLGHTALCGSITSDRILDTDCSWLKNQHIAIIDDAVISGTTLHSIKKQLLACGVQHVTTHVFCVCPQTFNPDLVEISNPALKLTELQTMEFCASIVDALSVFPRPYSVDFPLLFNVGIKKAHYHQLHHVPDWTPHDVSSSLQTANNIFSTTLIPNTRILRDLDLSCGWPVSQYSKLQKIRVYGDRRQPDGGLVLHLVPIVVLDPLPPDNVDAIWQALILSPALKASPELRLITQPTAKLRFLQYIISSKLAELWLEDVSTVLKRSIRGFHDRRRIGLLFPPPTVNIIEEFASTQGPLRLAATFAPLPTVPITTTYSCSPMQSHSPAETLTSSFLKMFEDKECPARQLAKQLGSKVFQNTEYQNTVDRLNSGISFPELRSTLSGIRDERTQTLLTSLFLDVATDRGIVVPVTVMRHGLVYRAYRHGEEVKFGLVQERLCGLLLQACCQGAKRSSLPHLWVEKLFVLMIKLGVKRSLLVQWEGPLGADGTVGVRYALKGAVVQEQAVQLFGHNPQGALTARLMRSGVLNQLPDSGLYRPGIVPSAVPTKHAAEAEVTKLGLVMGTALNANNRLISDRELILLATCSDTVGLAAGLAAEIQIACTTFSGTSYIAAIGHRDHANAAVTRLRRSLAFEAVNSGAFKFRAGVNGTVRNIIADVAARFEEPLYREEWRSMWSGFEAQPLETMPEPMRGLITGMGAWLIAVNIVMRIIECHLHCAAKGSVPKRLGTEVAALAEELRALPRLSLPNQQSFCKWATDYVTRPKPEAQLSQVCEPLLKRCESLLRRGRAFIDEVNASIDQFGHPRTFVKFKCAMFCEVSAAGDGMAPCANMEALDENLLLLHRALSGRQKVSDELRVNILPHGYGGFHSGRWISAVGKTARLEMLSLAVELVRALGATVNLRIILFSDLSSEQPLVLAERSAHYIGSTFWAFAERVVRSQKEGWARPYLVAILPALRHTQKRFASELMEKLSSAFIEQAETLWSADRDWIQREFVLRHSVTTSKESVASMKCNVGVLTVLTEEVRALKSAIESERGYFCRKGPVTGRLYYCGQFRAQGDRHIAIACTQPLEPGQRSVMPALRDLIQECSPTLIVILGIGGSISKDVTIGDVVIGTQIIYYDKRKDTPGGVVRRGESEKLSPTLAPYLNAFFVEAGEPAAHSGPTGTFKVHRGPIGSGEAVVAFRDSSIRQYLTEFNDKTLAVEMEAGGAVQELYEEAAFKELSVRPLLVVRGISDHADVEKDDRFKVIASENVVRAFRAILAETPYFGELFW